MQIALTALLILALFVPTLLCCFGGGYYLFFGLLALFGWLFLACLVVEEWWNWYRGSGDGQDNP